MDRLQELILKLEESKGDKSTYEVDMLLKKQKIIQTL